MNSQRAKEIVASPTMVNVTCDGIPIYIQHVDEKTKPPESILWTSRKMRRTWLFPNFTSINKQEAMRDTSLLFFWLT